MKITTNASELVARMQARAAALAPGSPQVKAALTRIGLIITARAKMNARRKGIVDTGRLINSLRYEVFAEGNEVGVRVGSFGVPYAALHEFGGIMKPNQLRAMFWAMKRRGGPKMPSKGVLVGNRFRARPYLRPAVLESRGEVLNAMREILSGQS